MRALFIKHDPHSLPGFVGERLVQRGYHLEQLPVVHSYDQPNVTVDFGDPSEFDLIIPLGSIFSVYDEPTIGNWINAEIDFLADAHRKQVPILGICFGGQALAMALGGKVEKATEPEIGWIDIRVDDQLSVPVEILAGPWMSWHFDRFWVPDAGQPIAHTTAATQAFIQGRSLGLQFHPEASNEIVECWLKECAPDGPEANLIDPDSLMSATVDNTPHSRKRCHYLVDWFLDNVASVGGHSSAGTVRQNP